MVRRRRGAAEEVERRKLRMVNEGHLLARMPVVLTLCCCAESVLCRMIAAMKRTRDLAV